MSTDEVLDPADMGKIPFLSGLLPAEVEALCAAGDVRRFDGGGVVFEAGDTSRELHVVIDGRIAIELSLPGGLPRRLATLGPGAIFGEINYLLGTQRTASARALEPTRVLVFSREAFDGLGALGRLAATSMMETVARVLALRLSRLDREMAELCARVVQRDPQAADLMRQLDEQRDVLKHEWAV